MKALLPLAVAVAVFAVVACSHDAAPPPLPEVFQMEFDDAAGRIYVANQEGDTQWLEAQWLEIKKLEPTFVEADHNRLQIAVLVAEELQTGRPAYRPEVLRFFDALSRSSDPSERTMVALALDSVPGIEAADLVAAMTADPNRRVAESAWESIEAKLGLRNVDGEGAPKEDHDRLSAWLESTCESNAVEVPPGLCAR